MNIRQIGEYPGSVGPAGMHTDHINPDGTIDDTVVETYYAPCTGGKLEDGYIRIFADNGGTDIETRVSFPSLIVLGWTPPAVGGAEPAGERQPPADGAPDLSPAGTNQALSDTHEK